MPPNNCKEESMKKWYVAIGLLVLAILFLAGTIGYTMAETTERNDSDVIMSEKGTYAIFRTQDPEEFLDFMEDFDENQYELVDITTSMTTRRTSEFYVVTYKTR